MKPCYLVNQTGATTGYPSEGSVAEKVSVVVGIHDDRQQQTTDKRVVRTMSQEFEPKTVTLEDGEPRDRPILLSVEEAREKRVRLSRPRRQQRDVVPYRERQSNIELYNE
jgi:uncharacterized membrane protein